MLTKKQPEEYTDVPWAQEGGENLPFTATVYCWHIAGYKETCYSKKKKSSLRFKNKVL